MQQDSCSGKGPSPFVFTLGSCSGAYCSFPSCSWCLCTWWNGGTHPSSSFQAERWGTTYLSVSLMFVNLQQLSSPPDEPVSSWGVTSSRCVWYRLIILFLCRLENMRRKASNWNKPHPIISSRRASRRKRKQWKFNFLTIRTSPS